MKKVTPYIPHGIVLEKPARNLDSLAQTEAIIELKATLIHEWKIRHKFDDVAQYGIVPTNIALFYGPPGNGKTVAAKMLAKAINSPLYRVACENLIASHLGESEKNMATVMEFLANAGQCVVLFDECEALFRKRKTNGTDCSNAISSTMQVFWQALDRWDSPQMFLLATNLREVIDPALLSRCDLQVEFSGPTREHTMSVIEYWMDTLHEYGSDVWGPHLKQHYETTLPESFRELWQVIQGNVKAHIIAVANGK